MRPIVEAVVDKGSFFEMGRHVRPRHHHRPRAARRAAGRDHGERPVLLRRRWTADVCDKIIRFVDLAETFHLPIVYLCDCPGFHIGLEAEKAATIRKGVRAMAAVNQSSVPWCTFLVRNVFGVAGAVNQPSGRFSIRYAWLSARWGSLPLEGGIEAAYRAEIDAAPDRDAKIAEIEERLEPAALAVPHRRDVLDRGDHRPARHPPLAVEFANLAEKLREPGERRFCMRP